MKTSILPAQRINDVNEYYFSSKLREIESLKQKGHDIISLAIGNPSNPPSEETINSLKENIAHLDWHGYQPTKGIDELRKNASYFYKRFYNVTIDPQEEILPLIGSKEGILHITLAFVNVGDKVLVPNPGYPTYSSLSKILGAEVIPYNLTAKNNWLPDFDALEQMDLSKVKLMWVNYPHMPTGSLAPQDTYKKLVQFGQEHGILIVNDNPYSLILNDQPKSILQIENAKSVCIELNSMSKSHNMAGWRVGFCCSNPQFVSWILKIKSNIDSGTLKPLQLAASDAFYNSDQWHKQNNYKDYYKKRLIGWQILQELKCSFDKNTVGMFLWGKIPKSYSDARILTDQLLYEAGVFLTPGFIFGSNGISYIRLSLCANENELLQALIRIQHWKKNKNL